MEQQAQLNPAQKLQFQPLKQQQHQQQSQKAQIVQQFQQKLQACNPEQSQHQRKDSMVSQQKLEVEAEQKLEQRKRQDAKSIFIENVDYKSTPEELKIIFEDCGNIARITIAKDPLTKQPKGFAYLSFEDEADVQMALNLTGTKLRGRIIRVKRKRTNLRGMTKKTPEQNSKQLLNMMMMKMANQQNFRGRPRTRGK